MRFDAIKVLLAGLMIVLMPSYVKGQGLYAREYTEESPLIYEDAWDLWPYVFLNEHGEPVGFNIDLLKELFHDLNIPYVIKLKPTSEALNDMKPAEKKVEEKKPVEKPVEVKDKPQVPPTPPFDTLPF